MKIKQIMRISLSLMDEIPMKLTKKIIMSGHIIEYTFENRFKKEYGYLKMTGDYITSYSRIEEVNKEIKEIEEQANIYEDAEQEKACEILRNFHSAMINSPRMYYYEADEEVTL